MQKNRLRQCSVKATYNSVARKILALSFILFSCCGCVAVSQEGTLDPVNPETMQVNPDPTEDNENKIKEMKREIEYNLQYLNSLLEIMDKGFSLL